MKIAMVTVAGRMSVDGSRLISALLKQAGHSVVNVFLVKPSHLEYDRKEVALLGEILKDVDLVMVAVYSLFSRRAVQLTELVYETYPGMMVIWGGPHCVAAPEISLQHADAVCYSEGDECVVGLVHRLETGGDWLETPGMAFKVNGSPALNRPLPPFADLDRLPFSDFSLEDAFVLDGALSPLTKEGIKEHFTHYPFGAPTFMTLTSRGCPHLCSYCNNCRYAALFGKNSIRLQGVDRFMDELESHLGALDFFTRVGFGDDDFFVRPASQLEQFARRYRKNVGLPFSINLSAGTYRQKKMEILLDSGLRVVQIGVQSGSDRVLKEVYNRKVSLARVKEIVQDIAPLEKAKGPGMILDFIVDNPYETREDIRKTYQVVLDMPERARIHYYALSFFPGTPLYDRALEDGFIEPFSEKGARSYVGSIVYQQNYETLLLAVFLMLHRRGMRRFFPKRFLRWLCARPLCAVANLMPRKVFDFLIRLVRKATPGMLARQQ